MSTLNPHYNFLSVILKEEPEQQTQFSSNDYDYLSSWQDIYLRGAYEKRVEDLEKFAQDKNFWAAAAAAAPDNYDEDINYVSSILQRYSSCQLETPKACFWH